MKILLAEHFGVNSRNLSRQVPTVNASLIKTGILGAKIHIKIHVNSLKVSSFLKNSQNSQNRQIHPNRQNNYIIPKKRFLAIFIKCYFIIRSNN